jgi:hypothetical protein
MPVTITKKQIMLEDCLCSECINQTECDYRNYYCPAWRFLDRLLTEKDVERHINAWEEASEE